MSRIFSFKGRLNRKYFALGCLLLISLAFPFRAIFDLALHSLEPKFPLAHVPATFSSIIFSQLAAQILVVTGFGIILMILIVVLSLLVRRLHDINLPGWVAIFLLAIIQVIPDFGVPPFVPSTTALVLILVMAIIPGTTGQNKYGA